MVVMSSIVASRLGVDYSVVGAIIGLLGGHVVGGGSLSDISVGHFFNASTKHKLQMAIGAITGGFAFGLVGPLP